jgi:tRNA pseudouridine55 synthase
VHRFDVADGPEPGVLRIEVTCSSGTYVRVLAADLGRLLGGGAHLRELRRTAIGSFTEAEACPLDAVTLLPPEETLRDYPSLAVDAAGAEQVGHGGFLEAPEGDGPWAVFGPEGELLAMYEAHPGRPGRAKPAVVLAGR